MWAKVAKEEHDAFAAAPRDRVSKCITSGSSLAKRWSYPKAGTSALTGMHSGDARPRAVQPLRRLSDDLDGVALAEFLVGGVLKAELHPARAHSLNGT